MPQYIYINGYPGVGKLTVADELSKLIPGSKVFHNHLVIDPVAAMLDRGSEGYDDLRANFRRHALHTIATHPVLWDTTFIFTDSRELSARGIKIAGDYQTAAAVRGVPFISIVLHCNFHENLKRVEGRSRVAEGERRTKLTDGEILRQVREDEIFRFGGKLEVELDITDMKPEEAARTILQRVNAVTNEMHEAVRPPSS